MDREEFLRQVREYEEVDRSALDQAYKVPLTLLRVWFNSGYIEVMDRRAART
jgi:hypothetical protein